MHVLVVKNTGKLTRTSQHNIKVQAVNADGGVVFDSKINVFLDTKSKISCVTKVVLSQLVFSDFQAPFKDFLCLGPSDSAMYSNLFITADAKRPDSVAGFGEDWLLSSKLFQHLEQIKHGYSALHYKSIRTHLGCSCQSVTRFTNTDVQAQFANAQFAHRVLGLVLLGFLKIRKQ
jgi:hypothetical protein